MTVFVDATTARHARGIGIVIDAVTRSMESGPVPTLIARAQADEIELAAGDHLVRLARTRLGRLAYQRLLMPLDIASLDRKGRQVDRVLLLDSYLPLIRGRHGPAYAVLVHDTLPLTHPDYWPAAKRVVKHAAFASLRRGRPLVFTSTEQNAVEIRRLLAIEARVVRFGCGQVSDEEADAAIAQPLAVRDRYFIAVGTFEERKNLPVLIDAFERGGSSLADFRLLLVGGGRRKYEAWLRRRVADSPVGDRIELRRNPGATEAKDLISRAAALVMPSLAEGFGLPVVEALALGTPVLASDLPSIRSWAGDAIQYAAPTDAGTWIAQLRSCADATDDARRAGQSFARSYRWDGCARALLAW
jgi:glycosyltransferase involved in cell wall biosynthesis